MLCVPVIGIDPGKMNPQMMQQAQNMMANMSPEQLAGMQNMVQNMSPEQRSKMERIAQQHMGGMGGVPPTASGQNEYQLGGARMLKDEGNNLHKAGKHTEALAKYEKAISNVSALTSGDAVELKTSCELNKAMCHLKLEQWKSCETVCSQVLTRGGNLKAYYRRGQANMGLEKWSEAVKDLKHALCMCAQGDAQRDLISDKLTEALNRCPEGADTNIDTPAAPSKPKSYNDGSIVIEEVTDEPEIQPANNSQPAASPVGSGRAEYVSEMMKNNPEQARQMMEQMGNLPPEEIQKMASMAGMPGFDASTAQQVAEMMKAMPPEQMQEMAQMAERMHNSGATGAAAGAPGASGAAPAVDPGMAADMLQNMSPDQIASMAEAAKSSGMMPQGMELDADMIKMSAEMMKNMSKEDLAKMQSMAASTGGPSGPAPSGAPMGGAAPPGNMAEMLNNPEAMNSAMNMMKNMDKDSLKNMLKMSQPGMTDEAAEKAAEAMKNMDERVMKTMMKGMAGFQKAKSAADSLVQWITARPAVMIALVVLMIAVILRVAGFM